jgi:hypothetical protein
MPELRDQLRSTLGSSYSIERELGGGRMSRIFVAEDRSLQLTSRCRSPGERRWSPVRATQIQRGDSAAVAPKRSPPGAGGKLPA